MRHDSSFLVVPVLAAACCAPGVLADTETFSGALGVARPAFEAAAGCGLRVETFDSFPHGVAVSELPNVDAVITDENAAGESVGLPWIQSNTPITPPRWVGNFGTGRPAWSPWVIRPVEGEAIHALGQVNAQGDWVRIDGYDAKGELVVTVDAPPIAAGGFAGFVTDVPILRVVITPLGNFDGLNGLDDLAISIVPPTACPADVNGDGAVDGLDLGVLLGAWGGGDGDVNCDGVTDGADLAIVLGAWGSCG